MTPKLEQQRWWERVATWIIKESRANVDARYIYFHKNGGVVYGFTGLHVRHQIVAKTICMMAVR
jgi:hypothetical protein